MSVFALGIAPLVAGLLLLAFRRVVGGPDWIEKLGWFCIAVGAILYGATVIRGDGGPLLRNS